MKALFKQYGFTFFLIVAATHLAAILLNQDGLRVITKPLLMPLLAFAVWIGNSPGTDRNLIVVSLFFSFLGDSFLLFDDKNSLYFIFGLASFLITHILYIFYFLKIRPSANSLLKQYPWIFLLVILYGAGLVYFLYPHLGGLKLPVMVYAIIICSMLLCSIHIYKRVKKIAGCCFILGALLFVVSDSLLAINKFSTAFSYASFLIMLTYCAAQYFIAKGFVLEGRA